MRISNSNVHAAIIVNHTSRKQAKSVNGVAGNQEKQPSLEKKALNKSTNVADKALIYEYGVAANRSRDYYSKVNQRRSEVVAPEFDSALHQTSKNTNNIRGKLVPDNQNSFVATAINSYTRHQELEQAEHVTQVMGVDLYA